MRQLRSRLTFPAVIIAAAILVVGTAGTAYAANEWNGSNIQDGTLTGADIQDNTIASADIANATVTSGDIANDSIVALDLASNSMGSDEIANGAVNSVDLTNNSVASVDILNGTIAGIDVEDGSLNGDDVSQLHGDNDIIDNTITTFDIATDAIDSDEVLDFGLSNQDVGVLFATVNADGTVANSSGGVTVIKLGSTGNYEVDFARDVTQCAFTGTVGPAGGGSALGELNVADRAGVPNAVFVDTNNSDGAAADKPFHLIVVC